MDDDEAAGGGTAKAAAGRNTAFGWDITVRAIGGAAVRGTGIAEVHACEWCGTISCG